MSLDPYTALWISYSSLSDFQKCPRLYYLRNVFRNPKTRKKLSLMSPPLALGQSVHAVIEQISLLPVEKRLATPPIDRLGVVWSRVTGTQGGFENEVIEKKYRTRAEDMLERLATHPGPILKPAIKLKDSLPHYWFSEENSIILCGKIDWLIYEKDRDAVHILDFKTGVREEGEDSLQLPIYQLLVTNVQKRPITGASYWYLDRDDRPKSMKLPDPESSHKNISEIAGRVKLARKLAHFKCAKEGGCMYCGPFEAIIQNKAKFVGLSDFGDEVYVLSASQAAYGSSS